MIEYKLRYQTEKDDLKMLIFNLMSELDTAKMLIKYSESFSQLVLSLSRDPNLNVNVIMALNNLGLTYQQNIEFSVALTLAKIKALLEKYNIDTSDIDLSGDLQEKLIKSVEISMKKLIDLMKKVELLT
jgi:hypothetical protein